MNVKRFGKSFAICNHTSGCLDAELREEAEIRRERKRRKKRHYVHKEANDVKTPLSSLFFLRESLRFLCESPHSNSHLYSYRYFTGNFNFPNKNPPAAVNLTGREGAFSLFPDELASSQGLYNVVFPSQLGVGAL